MPKLVLRTCLSMLMLVYELEFRSSTASYIEIGAIVINDPPPTPIESVFRPVRLIPTSPEATDAGLLSY